MKPQTILAALLGCAMLVLAAGTWSRLGDSSDGQGRARLNFPSQASGPDLKEYLSVLARAEDYGLNPEQFHYSRLAAAQAAGEPIDPTLEESFRDFVESLARGSVEPKSLGKGWERADQNDAFDLEELSARFLRGESIDYEALLPKDERFRQLLKALGKYRALAAQGGWITVATDPAPQQLAERLSVSGDLKSGAVDEAALAEALHDFQLRHGITPDGKVGKETLAALNVSVEERIEQIKINLERWRWLPQTLEPRFVEVNIPSFELTAYANGQPSLRLRVIVGKKDQPTPMLRSEITALEMNPDWDVPPSIAVNEMLPRLQEDPNYLANNHFVLLDKEGAQLEPPSDWSSYSAEDFPFRIRQIPGPWNSVGMLKFNFASDYGVYLHGTPSPELFERVSRQLSHGCVRLEDPLALAEFALSGSEWSRGRIEEQLSKGESTSAKLPAALPLYLTYWTAFVDDEGRVRFAPDIYGGDTALRAQIQRGRDRRTRTSPAST